VKAMLVWSSHITMVCVKAVTTPEELFADSYPAKSRESGSPYYPL